MNGIFLPDIFAETVFDIDLEKLKKDGIKAFIFDIDNTLATYAMPVADPKTAEWVRRLKTLGFEVFIASNNNHERVRVFSEDLGVTFFAKALKPLDIYLRKACKIMGVKPKETALVGDQLFTDIWGGNRYKCYTVLVTPIEPKGDPAFVKFKRIFEKPVMKKFKKSESN